MIWSVNAAIWNGSDFENACGSSLPILDQLITCSWSMRSSCCRRACRPGRGAQGIERVLNLALHHLHYMET